MEINEIKNAYVCSSYNREQLSKSKICGCFYCLKIFNPKLITNWCDDNQTAICPFCGIDSIIYDSETYQVSEEFLKQMKKYWFQKKYNFYGVCKRLLTDNSSYL